MINRPTARQLATFAAELKAAELAAARVTPSLLADLVARRDAHLAALRGPLLPGEPEAVRLPKTGRVLLPGEIG